jgi:hypothetical protein
MARKRAKVQTTTRPENTVAVRLDLPRSLYEQMTVEAEHRSLTRAAYCRQAVAIAVQSDRKARTKP